MSRLIVAMLALASLSVGASNGQDEAAETNWSSTKISFESENENTREPRVHDCWAYKGKLYLNVNHVDGHEFGSFEDGKFNRITLAGVDGREFDVDAMLDIGDSALLFGNRDNDTDTYDRRVFRFDGKICNEVKVVGKEGPSKFEMMNIGSYRLFGGRTWYVLKDDKLAQLTMEGGESAIFKPDEISADLSGRVVARKSVDWSTREYYLLNGTVFEKAPPLIEPEGASEMASAHRVFSENGVLVHGYMNDEDAIWYQHDGKWEYVVDPDGKRLELVESPTIYHFGEHCYIYTGNPECALYYVDALPRVVPVEYSDGASPVDILLSLHGDVPVSWDYSSKLMPYRLEGKRATSMLAEGPIDMDMVLATAGDAWFSYRYNEETKGSQLLVVRNGAVTVTTSELTYNVVEEAFRPVEVGGSVFFSLEVDKRQSLFRLDGSRVVPVRVKDSEQFGTDLVRGRRLTFAVVNESLFTLEHDFPSVLRRHFKEAKQAD